MKVSFKYVGYLEDGSIGLIEAPLENFKFKDKCLLAIDGSTDNTGVAVLREDDAGICASISFKRDSKTETPVQYKVKLKRLIESVLMTNTDIENIFYEEPFIGYSSSVANLFMLRTFIEEIIAENEPSLNYIKFTEVSNQKWKKLFFNGEKINIQEYGSKSKAEKHLAKEILCRGLPFVEELTLDETDAIAMGFVARTKLADGTEKQLQSKKRVNKFQFNSEFIGADCLDIAIQELWDLKNIPLIVKENGILMSDLSAREELESKIYSLMGSDDKLLMIKFESKKHGDIVLKYNIGALASNYKEIYALVWRKTRKY